MQICTPILPHAKNHLSPLFSLKNDRGHYGPPKPSYLSIEVGARGFNGVPVITPGVFSCLLVLHWWEPVYPRILRETRQYHSTLPVRHAAVG